MTVQPHTNTTRCRDHSPDLEVGQQYNHRRQAMENIKGATCQCAVSSVDWKQWRHQRQMERCCVAIIFAHK